MNHEAFHVPRLLPTSIGAALLSAVVGGVALGAIVGPVGVATGIGAGLVVGGLAGAVLEREDRRRRDRTRELDAIIGITEGTIGAGPVSMPSAPPLTEETWMAEWLTPPPPVTG